MSSFKKSNLTAGDIDIKDNLFDVSDLVVPFDCKCLNLC